MGPEKRFENKVKAYLESIGMWYVKFFANSKTKKGIPDILACKNGLFVALEIKSDDGRPSKLQLKKCKDIRNAGGFSFVVYPSGFEILKVILSELDSYDSESLPLILKGDE